MSITFSSKLTGKNLAYINHTLKTWKRQREELKVISFPAALGPQYESVKNQLLIGADLPSLNSIFSWRSRIPVEVDPSTDNEGNAALIASSMSHPNLKKGKGRARGASSKGGGLKDDRYCEFCHKPGHTEHKC